MNIKDKILYNRIFNLENNLQTANAKIAELEKKLEAAVFQLHEAVESVKKDQTEIARRSSLLHAQHMIRG